MEDQGESATIDTATLDADLVAYLTRPTSQTVDYRKCTVAEARAAFDADRGSIVGPPVGSVEQATIPGPGGALPLRIYRPKIPVSGDILLWFHGGGWVLGDLATADLPAATLCAEAAMTVVSLDYRLAPETQFPGAFDDCWAGTQWAIAHRGELCSKSGGVFVGGDSAGGNLAASIAIQARNAGVDLGGQVLVYPVIEPDFRSDTYRRFGHGYGLSTEAMIWFWDQYVPNEADRDDWRVAPLNADLAGVAPAIVLTVGFDPLTAEGIAYASALEQAGVEVATEHIGSAIHGVFAMPVTSGARSRAMVAKWLQKFQSTP